MFSLSKIPDFVILEHETAKILQRQETYGWKFDVDAARQLTSTLQEELQEAKQVLRDRHPFVEGSSFTPKRDNKTQGYVAGCSSTRLKELNPTSRDHIAWVLQTFYEWKPTQLTATGKPIIDEPILKEIGTDIALLFLKCLDTTKKLGMISEGVNAWLKLVTNVDRIHHHCSTATNTFRCSHRSPNLAQVPSNERFRKLFTASRGMVMCGADLAGVELRMLSHYLARYDDGRYADILLNGDIHQVNADAIGVSRSTVKSISYAFLYGAGNIKLGLTYDKQLSENKAKAKGKEIRAAYIAAIPGLDQLLQATAAASEKGFLKAIDGRKILLDSKHKSLNYLLQGSSAVLAKRWLYINQTNINDLKLKAHQLAFVHDELQFECPPEQAADLCTSLVLSALAAGEYYKLRIKIEAEAKQGLTWADVH
jgi:DNA polymerase I-like protein with 3'-5' exonuclease and polymerase domains